MSHKVCPPWTWDGTYPVQIKDAEGCTVCDLFPSAEEHIVPLICAAPDMARRLEVAQRMADALKSFVYLGHAQDTQMRRGCISRAEAALAEWTAAETALARVKGQA